MNDLRELFSSIKFDRVDVVEYLISRRSGDVTGRLPLLSPETAEVHLEWKVEAPSKVDDGFLAYLISAGLSYSLKDETDIAATASVTLRVLLAEVPDDVSQANIRKIGEHLVRFQVWAFLRERLHSASAMLGVPVLIPFLMRDMEGEPARPKKPA